MRSRYASLLLAIAMLWGASYMFIKIGVRDFAPTTLMLIRVVLAASALFAYLASQHGARATLAAMRAAGRGAYALGVVNAAAPFTLIAWGERHIDSGIAAIANSAVPIFVVLFAFLFVPGERVSGSRLFGVLLGLVGVGLVVGVDPHGGWLAVLGALACVLAAACYGAATLWGQRLVVGVSGPVLALTATVGASIALLPFGLAQAPAEAPGWKPAASVLVLALGGTALAQILFYRLLREFGSSRASLVVYLLPPVAVVYGVVFLGESLRALALGGLALILLGIGIGSGALRLSRLQTKRLRAAVD
jgi:drug/metabolite transporter (DMT)-like permease